MKLTPIALALTVSFLIGCLAGCSKDKEPGTPTGQPGQEPPGDTSTDAMSYPHFSSKYIGANGNQTQEKGNAITPEILSNELEKRNWSDPATQPSFTVHRSAEESLTLKLTTPEGGGDAVLVAIWERPEKEGKMRTQVFRRSPPIASKEAGFDLVKSYAAGDGDLESATGWSVIARGMSGKDAAETPSSN